jgi:hypothetical protein
MEVSWKLSFFDSNYAPKLMRVDLNAAILMCSSIEDNEEL